MPKKKKVAPQKAKAAKPKEKKARKPKAAKVLLPKPVAAPKPKAKKATKAKKAVKAKKAPKELQPAAEAKAEVLSSEMVFEGPLFRVLRDRLIEPGGKESDARHHPPQRQRGYPGHRQHKNKRDPWVVVERQYRHAANHYLWELPAGKLEAGEDPLQGAQRELVEETGYRAKKWKPLVEYYASPGFLGESMIVFVAEGLVAGDAHPEDDEHIDFRLVKLSELLKLIEKGAIVDGKTLTAALLYVRRFPVKGKK